MNYWEKRRVFDIYNRLKSAEEVAKNVAEVYRKASAYLKSLADKIFGKFRSRHGLSGAAARRFLNRMRDKGDVDELMRQLANAEQTEEIQNIRMELEAGAYQARLDRVRDLQEQINTVIEDVYGQDVKQQGALYAQTANDGYYETMYRLQQQSGSGFSFAHIDPDVIDRMTHSRWSGENYSERIWGNTQKLAERLKEEILVSLLTGRTADETAKVIDNEFHVGAYNSRRLIRTEMNYVYNEFAAIAYEEAGVEEYLYLATLDLRTSKVCRGLDGQIFKVAERMVGENYPPMHPWCRSTTTAVIDRKLLEKLKRSAIDPTTGKRIQVPMTMTYQEWYNKYVKGHESEIKNRGQAPRISDNDREQFEKYKAIFGDEVPNTVEDFLSKKHKHSDWWDDLKRRKQEKLNSMEFKDMQDLVGKLGNREVRAWYNSKDDGISEKLDPSAPILEQSMQAHAMRNEFRTQARDLMRDQELRKKLDVEHPNIGHDELIADKMSRKNMTYDEAVRDVIKTAGKTNKKVNESLGLG